MWLEQICRLCAQVSEVIFPIFSKDGEKTRLDTKIKKCLSLMISEDDCKPKHICYNCTTKLEDYYDFLQVCESSDYKFETILYTTTQTTDTPSDRWNDNCDKTTMLPEQTVTVPHDSVIVVGKMDDSQTANLNPQQDILLMVELKYKDVEMDPLSTTDIMRDNKILYATTNECSVLKEKSIVNTATVYTQSVLRHSDEFVNKLQFPDSLEQQQQQLQPQQLNHTYSQTYTTSSCPETKTKPFPCSECNKSFMRRSNLNAHMSTHTQIRPYQCEQCDRSFALRWNLTVHQRLHTGLYTCEFCSKAFPVKGKLERHRRIHTGEKPFACSVCSKAFADKRNLEAHLRTHSEDRPFACDLCTRSFRTRSHLMDHQRVHSEETPFSCHTCGKCFKWKTNLTIHLRSHTGERSECVDCGKQFTRTTQLIKHRRLQHGASTPKRT